MNPLSKGVYVLVALAMAILVSACASQQIRTRSSVVEYLYPKDAEKVVQPATPVLHIPIKVGIAFVPEQGMQAHGASLWAGVVRPGMMSEAYKMQLLEKIAAHFRKLDYVADIEVIPSPYLTPGGSFANLDQIRTMYGVDVMALVSYDQVQFTDEGMLSLSYWTLVGAYVISGEKNDTSTMLDTAVYDIPSRKMLFRAPGVSSIKGTATPVNLSEQLRLDSTRGFEDAAAQMISNLDLQLEGFREKIKQQPERVKIVPRAGTSGGVWGSGIIGLLVLLISRRGLTVRG